MSAQTATATTDCCSVVFAMRTLTYRGVSRRGVARTGRTAAFTPADLAEHLYQLGFRWAEISDAETGEPDAGVRRDPETGRRIWWGALS